MNRVRVNNTRNGAVILLDGQPIGKLVRLIEPGLHYRFEYLPKAPALGRLPRGGALDIMDEIFKRVQALEKQRPL